MSAAAVDRARWPYRMKDLSDLTGMPRQAIHFYIHEGLVPEGHKTGRNMAYYDDRHVERIKLIKRLQEERFLPLKAIRAVLDENDDAFTPAQRRLMQDVKQHLGGRVAPRAGKRETIDAKPLLLRAGLDKKDLDAMAEMGLLVVEKGARGKLLVAKDDAWMIELWGEVRAAGFTRDLGFDVSLLHAFEEAISTMFEKETILLKERLSHLPAAEVAAMVERALPLVHTFLVRYHETKIRNFFSAL